MNTQTTTCPSCRATPSAYPQCKACGWHVTLLSRRCVKCQGALGMEARPGGGDGGLASLITIIVAPIGAAAGWYFASSLIWPMVIFFALLAVAGLAIVPRVGLRCQECRAPATHGKLSPDEVGEVKAAKKKLLWVSAGLAGFALVFGSIAASGVLDEKGKPPAAVRSSSKG